MNKQNLWRSGLMCSMLVALLLLAGAVTLARPATARTMLSLPLRSNSWAINGIVLTEDWESGIDPTMWKPYGSPLPSLYPGQGRDGSTAIDNNGDASYDSGVITWQEIALTNGVDVEYWMRGHGSVGAPYQVGHVALSLCHPVYDNMEACEKPLARVYAETYYNRITYQSRFGSSTEQWAPLDGTWHKYRIAITEAGFVQIYRDDVLKYSSSEPIDFGTYPTARLRYGGRNRNSYWYVDDMVVTVNEPPTPTPSPTPTPAPCPFPDDTHHPSGAVHAHDNMLWPPNNKMVDVTLSGYVIDELSIARDGEGIGISTAFLQVGEYKIVLRSESIDLLGEDGRFSVTVEVKAEKGAIYDVELYAADTEPIEDGGPNSGLVDSTYIRVSEDMAPLSGIQPTGMGR